MEQTSYEVPELVDLGQFAELTRGGFDDAWDTSGFFAWF